MLSALSRERLRRSSRSSSGCRSLGAFVNGIWGKRLGKPAVRLMALAAVGVELRRLGHRLRRASRDLVEQEKGEHVKLAWTAWEWMHTTGGNGGATVPIDVKFSIDALSGVMMLIVTGVGFLIHLYATSYMAEDHGLRALLRVPEPLHLRDARPHPRGQPAAALRRVGGRGALLVPAHRLLVRERRPTPRPGKKAFIANRIGDFGLSARCSCSCTTRGRSTGTASPTARRASCTRARPYRVHVWPLGGGHYEGLPPLPAAGQARSRSAPRRPSASRSSSAAPARARRSRSTCGSPTRWRAPRRSPRSSTRRRWSPRASTSSAGCRSSSSCRPSR